MNWLKSAVKTRIGSNRHLHLALHFWDEVCSNDVDFLIAYKAMRHRLTLLHADRDFDRIARWVPLKVESYAKRIRV